MEQFKDFEALVAAIEPLALRGGVCKIIPPKAWRAELEQSAGDRRVFADEDFPIMKPIVQHFNGSSGIFHQYNVEFHRKLKLAQFFQISQDDSHRVPDKLKTMEESGGKSEGGDEKSGRDKSRRESGAGTRRDQRKSRGSADGGLECEEQRVVESETVGVAVDYKKGKIRLTSAAAEALKTTTRSEAMRTKFQAAVAAYRPHPEVEGEAAGDSNGMHPPRLFTGDDGRALFVAEKEYAENEELERIYWKNMLFQPPMYGADVLGTLFPEYKRFPHWNIRNLPGLLRQIGQRMPGVNDPYLYLGMWKATFAWHVEDMDLYSINYIHFGAPKAWYAIPIDARSRFEMSMQNVFANDYKSCSQFLRHKAFLLSPRFLASQSIPFNRVVQRAGEIVLTFPLGYHAGFNHGFNCAESVNFALERWLDVAWQSKHCECVKDSVTIDLMEWFGSRRGEKPGAARADSEADVVVDDDDDDGNDNDDVSLRDRIQRDSPRRHAAAAAAAAAVGGAKRKQSVSSAQRGEPVAKRSPGKAAKKAMQQRAAAVTALVAEEKKSSDIAAEKADESTVDATDVWRRFGSLHTPVGMCGACLLPILGFDSDSAEPEAVVECEQCGLTVHSQCSALACDDAHYRCANCVMDTDQLPCALCAFQNGLMLPVSPDSPTGDDKAQPPAFAHILCANFINEAHLSFPSPDKDDDLGEKGDDRPTTPTDDSSNGISTRARTAARAVTASKQAIAARTRIPLWKFDAKRSDLPDTPLPMSGSAMVTGVSATSRNRTSSKCMFCYGHADSRLPGAAKEQSPRKQPIQLHQCFGPVVQCAHPKCSKSFHPMCAAIRNPDLLDWSQAKAFCSRHSSFCSIK
ncbi:hypothetical protein H4217_003380 [Coemansia sp. RSA 1939]|nr:hypothetical protein H4217_003380 [Coemansia sp. RSA 1939]KAJ2613705.1 hypothetical protein EV177_002419 [Coemansia sp. RSA 1804]